MDFEVRKLTYSDPDLNISAQDLGAGSPIFLYPKVSTLGQSANSKITFYKVQHPPKMVEKTFVAKLSLQPPLAE